MASPLLDAFRHNAWANQELLRFCLSLSEAQLNATVTGAYGSILETLKHLLGAEAYYSFVVSGRLPEWEAWDNPSVDAMEGWATEMATFWEETLSRPLEAETLIIRQHESGTIREVRAGILLAQALHHANVHREQICTILTSLGIEPPDLDVWTFGTVTGRHSLTTKGD